jgi:hypothetical protein
MQVTLLEFDERNLWFEQDGASCHTTQISVAFLRELFDEDQLILTTKGI